MVDDVIISFDAQFKLKDFPSLNYFLGVKVTSSDDYLLPNQKKYVHDLLTKVVVFELVSFPTLMTCDCLTRNGMELCFELFHDETLYLNTIGALQHICVTRPDIHFGVNKLIQYMQTPSKSHWKEDLHVLDI